MLVRPRLLSLLFAATITVAGSRAALASRPVDAGCDRCDAARPVGSRLAPVVAVPARPAPAAPKPAVPTRPDTGHKATLARPHVTRGPQRAKTGTRQQPATPGMQMLLRLSSGSHTELSWLDAPHGTDRRTLEGRGPPRAGPDRPLLAPSGAPARVPSGPTLGADRGRSAAEPASPPAMPPAAPCPARPRTPHALDDSRNPTGPVPVGFRARPDEGTGARHLPPSRGVLR